MHVMHAHVMHAHMQVGTMYPPEYYAGEQLPENVRGIYWMDNGGYDFLSLHAGHILLDVSFFGGKFFVCRSVEGGESNH
jgi:hypothetical protein